MSLFMKRPQRFDSIFLNIGDEYGRPQNVHDFGSGVSPGVDTEMFEETVGVFGAIIYDDGVETGFVLLQEQ